MVKLTLSAEKEVVRKAKRLAAAQKTSVSALFERFVRSAAGSEAGARPVGRLTKKASGIIRTRGKKKDRELVEDALLDKYGLK